MSEVLKFGPPFTGIQDRPDERGVQCTVCHNLLPNRGVLEAVAPPVVLDADRPSNAGVFVMGSGERAVVLSVNVTPGAVGLFASTPSAVTYTATRDAYRVEVPLSAYYSEAPTRTEPYQFAVLGRKCYFSGGQQVFEVDRATLDVTPMELSEGRESNTVGYMKYGSIPARVLCVHNGRMWYALSEQKDFQTHVTIDPNDPMIPDPSKLNLDGTVRYTPAQILFSDPYEPNHVKWLSAFDIEDEGCEVTGLVSWNGSLIILTTKGLWLLDGEDESDWTLTKLSEYASCLAPGSVAASADRIVWMGARCFWVLDTSRGLRRLENTDWFFDWQAWWGEHSNTQKPVLDAYSGSTGAFVGGGKYYVVQTIQLQEPPAEWDVFYLYAEQTKYMRPAMVVDFDTGAVATLDAYLPWNPVGVWGTETRCTIARLDIATEDSGFLVGQERRMVACQLRTNSDHNPVLKLDESLTAFWVNDWYKRSLELQIRGSGFSRLNVNDVAAQTRFEPVSMNLSVAALDERNRLVSDDNLTCSTPDVENGSTDSSSLPVACEEPISWADTTDTEPTWAGTTPLATDMRWVDDGPTCLEMTSTLSARIVSVRIDWLTQRFNILDSLAMRYAAEEV